MAEEGPEGSHKYSSGGKGWAADLSSKTGVRRIETHGTSISFSVKDQKLFKEKLQHQPSNSSLTTEHSVGLPVVHTGV